jgi:quinol monooxygenase YgiN
MRIGQIDIGTAKHPDIAAAEHGAAAQASLPTSRLYPEPEETPAAAGIAPTQRKVRRRALLTCGVMDSIGTRDQFHGSVLFWPWSGSMPVTYLIKFDVVPGRRDEFLELLDGVLDAMRAEPMFHEAILHRDPASDHRFMLYETWESHEDVLNVQLRRPYRQAWHEALPRLLRQERDVTIWEPVRCDRGQR